MSCNRENVIWQSENGTWNRAFYAYYDVNTDSDDFDYEWDVEYTDDFNWVVTGLASEDAADNAWSGANPGGYSVIAFSPDTARTCAQLDAKASAFKEREKAERAKYRATSNQFFTGRR